MRLFLIAVFILIFNGCKSTSLVTDNSDSIETVNMHTDNNSLGKASKWFSEESRKQIESTGLIHDEGEDILSQILIGYKNQIGNIEFMESDEAADLTFKIKSVTVNRGRFTFNFLKPGPIYVMRLKADIIFEEEVIQTITKKTVVNMGVVAFPDESVKWMKPSEKRIIDNQLLTFKKGLRKLYQDLYFDAFDISLSL